MKAPLEPEDDEAPQGEEEDDPQEDAPMRPVDEALDIDAEFRFPPTKFRTRRFNNWEDVAKIAFEVHLDEMRTLLELHYDDVSSSHATNSRRKRKGGVFASIAYAHRHHLNQKLILPTRA